MPFILNPRKFKTFNDRFQKIFFIFSALFLGVGLYFALWASPPDYQQSEMVRVMYIHVPCAWLGIGIYALMAGFSLGGFIARNPFWFLMSKAAAPIGFIFTLICMITGSLWGKPMWGTWWVWDARLTSVAVLAFLYLGYLFLVDAYEDRLQGWRMAAILSLIGLVNLPIIKWSVTWFNTLHQPSTFIRLDGPQVHASMLWPLIFMALGLSFLAIGLILLRTESELLSVQGLMSRTRSAKKES